MSTLEAVPTRRPSTRTTRQSVVVQAVDEASTFSAPDSDASDAWVPDSPPRASRSAGATSTIGGRRTKTRLQPSKASKPTRGRVVKRRGTTTIAKRRPVRATKATRVAKSTHASNSSGGDSDDGPCDEEEEGSDGGLDRARKAKPEKKKKGFPLNLPRSGSVMLSTLTLLAGVLSIANAAPLDKLNVVQKRATCPNDSGNIGTFSQPCATYTSAVTCPNGIQGKAGGIVLLVHGTGSTGSESWGSGPYVLELPTAGPGYDVCYVDLPGRSIGDAQVSSEYVAYNIKDLAAKSSTGKVSLVSHSQGGLNVQWAVDFWPQYRSLVHAFVGLAPDFHGTAEGPLACAAETLIGGGCNPSVIQQTVGSHFLAAVNKKGNQALVPTTSLYTHYDDVIQPEVILPATSALSGASVHAMQDLDVCGPGYIADHFTMIVSSVAYALTVDALTHDGNANPARINRAACFWAINDVVVLDDFNRTVALVRGAVNDVAALSLGPKTTSEPLLKPYVCSSGSATSYCSTS
ncbi:hypothetical protein JCM11491_005480 [Sporobolomyces phaffii]